MIPPELAVGESIETTRIYSAMGRLSWAKTLSGERLNG